MMFEPHDINPEMKKLGGWLILERFGLPGSPFQRAVPITRSDSEELACEVFLTMVNKWFDAPIGMTVAEQFTLLYERLKNQRITKEGVLF